MLHLLKTRDTEADIKSQIFLSVRRLSENFCVVHHIFNREFKQLERTVKRRAQKFYVLHSITSKHPFAAHLIHARIQDTAYSLC